MRSENKVTPRLILEACLICITIMSLCTLAVVILRVGGYNQQYFQQYFIELIPYTLSISIVLPILSLLLISFIQEIRDLRLVDFRRRINEESMKDPLIVYLRRRYWCPQGLLKLTKTYKTLPSWVSEQNMDELSKD